VHVPTLRIDRGDHPIRSDFPGDAPASVGPVRTLGWFHVLPSDQRQQRQRLSRLVVQFDIGQGTGHAQRVAHQRGNQRIPGSRVVPRDRGFAGIGVVMGVTARGDDLRRARGFPGHSADRSDQLGDGVLGSDRVIEHHGVQRTTGFPARTPVSVTTMRTASKIRFGRLEAASRRRQ
jgi:hypothetical protein